MFHLIIIFTTVVFSSLIAEDETIIKKEFDCVIIPSNVADLGSHSRGIIKRIDVDRNDFVKRGDVIAVLDNDVEQAVVDLVSRRASITSEISLRKKNSELAGRMKVRAENTYYAKALSDHEVDIARVDAAVTKIKLLQAKENQKIVRNELKRAKAELARKTIRAPFSGVVMERFKTIGEYIDDKAVVRIAQLDPLHVEVIIPVIHRGKIEAGMKAEVCSKIGTGWIATVSQVDRVMDVASGTFGIRLILPNSDYKIPAGLHCDLKFLTSEPKVSP